MSDRTRGLATPEQVAEWLETTPRALRRWRDEKRGPKWIKVGRQVRYAWSDVHAWCASNRGV